MCSSTHRTRRSPSVCGRWCVSITIWPAWRRSIRFLHKCVTNEEKKREKNALAIAQGALESIWLHQCLSRCSQRRRRKKKKEKRKKFYINKCGNVRRSELLNSRRSRFLSVSFFSLDSILDCWSLCSLFLSGEHPPHKMIGNETLPDKQRKMLSLSLPRNKWIIKYMSSWPCHFVDCLLSLEIYIYSYGQMLAFNRKAHLSKYWFLYGIVFAIILAFAYPEFGSKEGD
jgi:hypothetical protein